MYEISGSHFLRTTTGIQSGPNVFFLKKNMGFTPCKAEQPLQGLELQQKEASKD